MADEMAKWLMRWREGERFFLESIRCQVTLIFTLYFLHRTANQGLVFRPIQLFFFFSTERTKDQADGGGVFSTSLIAESY